jgi:HK97 family phage major capsid protein
MSTQATPPLDASKLAPLFVETDKRYAPAGAVEDVQKKYDAVSAKYDEALKQIAELKAAPAFIEKERLGTAKHETKLGRLLYATFIKRKTGVFPAEKEYSREVEFMQKAFASGTTAAGGFLLPEDWSTTIFQELGAKAIVLQAQPNVIPMAVKKLHVGGFGTDATFQWLGEGTASTESTSATAEITLALSTARLLSSFSVEYLRYSTPETEAAIQANLVRVLARGVDGALLFGSGANQPTGMGSVGSISTVGAAAGAANGGTLAYDDLVLMRDALDEADVPEERRCWLMHPRSWTRIRQLKDTTGRPLVYNYDNPLLNNEPLQLFGYPVYRSTKIPINQVKGTSGSVNSTILFVCMSDIYVGLGAGNEGIQIDISEHSAFANAQVQVRLLQQVDIKPAHAVSIGAITGVN